MRLTLRTLLAWLDDKLPPSEVREIGKQVGESPYAKELVARIHRVTRQRRLTIPPPSGPDAVDPNLVAAYIDNELDAERVAEFEKKCLTSDVHLAEVSSTHQILSLVGQKAKVPAEARLRMYSLIKGRESIRPSREEIEKALEPASEPDGTQAWAIPSPPRRRWLERFGPVAAVLGLIGVLVLSAWKTLTVPPGARTLPPGVVSNEAVDGPAAARAALRGEPLPGTVRAPEVPPPAPAPVVPAPAPVAERPPAPAAEEPAATTPSEIPAGAAGVALKPAGILLRYRTEERDWERLTDVTTLNAGDRILQIGPYRATLDVGSARIELVGETEVTVEETPKDLAARVGLARGRLVLHGTAPSLPFEVAAGGQAFTVTPPPRAAVGIEPSHGRGGGEAPSATARLLVHAEQAPVAVAVRDGAVSTLEEPGSIVVGAGIESTAVTPGSPPPWLTEAKPTDAEEAVGRQFLEFFRPNRPIISSLVEALEDEREDVCRTAITSLAAVGDVSYIIPLLNKQGDALAPVARAAAIEVLRGILAEGPEQAEALNVQLRRDLGEESGALAEKLLVGFTAAEAKEEATLSRLVALLEIDPEKPLCIRELALDNLKRLTGRDAMGYDPEKVDAAGLKAWKDLLMESRPAPAPARPKAQ